MGALRIALLLGAAGVVMGAVDATTKAPGGLTPKRTPQFILFTHDDAITQATHSAMTAVTDGVTSNGCPAVATMFVTSSGTDCKLLLDLYSKGYEIGDHTQSHPSLLKLGNNQLVKEILGARTKLAQCGIPEGDIQGLRAPFLEIKPAVWDLLDASGFLYDSTLIENTQGNSISKDMSERVWPWDMGNGIPINCAWYDGIQKCKGAGPYPGLWEIPLWDYSATSQVFTMDYGDSCSGSSCVYNLLRANFYAGYNGNRAPFPIFIHTPWLRKGTHLKQLQRFVGEVSQLPDVYFITLRQLIAWMKSPVAADQLTPANAPALLGCGNAGGAPPRGARKGAAAVATRATEGVADEPPGSSPRVEAEPAAAAPAPAPEEGYGQVEEGAAEQLAAPTKQLEAKVTR